MSFDRKIARKTARTYASIIAKGQKVTNEEGNQVHVLGSSHAEAVAALVAMPIPPPPPGSSDTNRDDIDPLDYRRLQNARKRARRAARAK